MNLPIYLMVTVKSAQLEDVTEVLVNGMNQHRPVALLIDHLNRDDQREVIGLVENWFSEGLNSPRYPYPVYLVSELGEALGEVPVVATVKALPAFFRKKEGKPNVRETQLIARNRIMQQEIRNSDPLQIDATLLRYGHHHRRLWRLVEEGAFYERLLARLRLKGHA